MKMSIEVKGQSLFRVLEHSAGATESLSSSISSVDHRDCCSVVLISLLEREKRALDVLAGATEPHPQL